MEEFRKLEAGVQAGEGFICLKPGIERARLILWVCKGERGFVEGLAIIHFHIFLVYCLCALSFIFCISKKDFHCK
jgi:hypothetical protein